MLTHRLERTLLTLYFLMAANSDVMSTVVEVACSDERADRLLERGGL